MIKPPAHDCRKSSTEMLLYAALADWALIDINQEAPDMARDPSARTAVS